MSYRITARGKLVPMDSKRPHSAVILAIDTATNSGWALFRRGQWLESGELQVSQADQIRTVIIAALGYGRASAIPVCIVLEKPPNTPFHSFASTAKLIAARDAWETAWAELAKPERQKNHHVRVYPQTWRSRVLGKTSGPELPELERSNAMLVTNREPGPDEAAAVCIGVWACTAGEVAKVLPEHFWGAR